MKFKKYSLRYRFSADTNGEIYYVIQRYYRGYYLFLPFVGFDSWRDIGPDDKYKSIKEAHQAIERLELAEREVKEYNTNGKV